MRIRTACKVPNEDKFLPGINHCINLQSDRGKDDDKILDAVRAPG
jgi:hypothetical protein